MNVTQRINARKIVLSYFYERCFFANLKKNDSALTEALFIDNVFVSQKEKFDEYKKQFLETINNYSNQDTTEDIEYYIHHFFDKWPIEEIDMDYVIKIGSKFDFYQKELAQSVDKYSQTFKFQEMDIIDQSLFYIGYIERKELETPKEILLNEIVELAKRYSDDGAPKLLNGIMHNIITNN